MKRTKFKQTEIGMIPEDWEELRLTDEEIAFYDAKDEKRIADSSKHKKSLK